MSSFDNWLLGERLPPAPPSLEGVSELELVQLCRSFGVRALDEVSETHWDALSRLQGLSQADRWRLALHAPGWVAARLVAGLAHYDPGGEGGELLQRLSRNIPGKMWKALPSPELVRGLMTCRRSWQAPPYYSESNPNLDLPAPNRRWLVRLRRFAEEQGPAVRILALDGGPERALPFELPWVHASFLPDSRLLVGGEGPHWELWCLDPWRRDAHGPVPGGRVQQLAGRSRVAVKGDQALAVYHGSEEIFSAPWKPQVFKLQWSPDGRWLAIADAEGIKLLGPEGGPRPLGHPPAPENRGTTQLWTRLAFSPDSRWLASGHNYYRSNEIWLWDVQTGEHVGTLGGLARGLASLTFTPDGRHLVALDGSNSGWHVFDLKTGKALSRPTTSHICDLWAVDDSTLAVGMGHNSVDFFTLTGEGQGSVRGGSFGVRDVSVDRTGMGVHSGDGSYREYGWAGDKPLGLWTDDDVRAAEEARSRFKDPATIKMMISSGTARPQGPLVHIAWSFLIDLVKYRQGHPEVTLAGLDVI